MSFGGWQGLSCIQTPRHNVTLPLVWRVCCVFRRLYQVPLQANHIIWACGHWGFWGIVSWVSWACGYRGHCRHCGYHGHYGRCAGIVGLHAGTVGLPMPMACVAIRCDEPSQSTPKYFEISLILLVFDIRMGIRMICFSRYSSGYSMFLFNAPKMYNTYIV